VTYPGLSRPSSLGPLKGDTGRSLISSILHSLIVTQLQVYDGDGNDDGNDDGDDGNDDGYDDGNDDGNDDGYDDCNDDDNNK
jgi:hypothetical protein